MSVFRKLWEVRMQHRRHVRDRAVVHGCLHDHHCNHCIVLDHLKTGEENGERFSHLYHILSLVYRNYNICIQHNYM